MTELYDALNILISLIEYLILIRIVLSIINFRMDNFVGELILNLTEPILAPARALIAKLNLNTGVFDFSPILAILFLRLFSSIVKRIMFF